MKINKKYIEAKVVGNKKYHEGTITVSVERSSVHPKYGKTIFHKKKFLVDHSTKDLLEIGTTVKIIACSPISKRKSFRIVEVLK